MRLSLAVSLLAVFTGHMTEAKGGRGKKGIVRKKILLPNSRESRRNIRIVDALESRPGESRED